MGSPIEITLTIIAMSFWILFPIGMFISVGHVDKSTDQVVRLDHLRHDSIDTEVVDRVPQKRYRPQPFDWHHPVLGLRRWLQH